MIPLPANLRHERKFTPYAMSLPDVLALIRRHSALFREVYPPRSVNNVYLDSPALGDYHDHVQGVAVRAKTRVRWYGSCSIALDQPALEHKIKRGPVGGKIGCRLPSLQLAADRPHEIVKTIRNCADVPAMLRAVGAVRLPSLVNRYRRRYYLSADGRFRLTVDWGLQVVGFRRFLAGEAFSAAGPAVIVELKYATCDAGPDAAAVANAFPFRLIRCSKYVLGIERLATGPLT
jgi:hypothetical protein